MNMKELAQEFYNRLQYPMCCPVTKLISVFRPDLEFMDYYESIGLTHSVYLKYSNGGFTTFYFPNGGGFIIAWNGTRIETLDVLLVLIELGFVKTAISFMIKECNDHHIQEFLDDLLDECCIVDDYQAMRTILNTDWNKLVDEFCDISKTYDYYKEHMKYENLLNRTDDYFRILEYASDHDATRCVFELLDYKKEWNKEDQERSKDIYL